MVEAIGLKASHIIKPGENLFEVLCETFELHLQIPQERSIIVIAETVVSTTQNRIIKLSDITNITPNAVQWSSEFEVEPAFAQLVLQESDEIIGGIPGMLFTVKSGILIANAGIDQSNAGGEGEYSLWPVDPFGVAEDLCKKIKEKSRGSLQMRTNFKTINESVKF